MNPPQESLDLLADLIRKATAAGADAADAILAGGASVSVIRRLGETEKVERSEGSDLGLRVFIGRRQAIVSTSDTSPSALRELVDRAVSMARSVPEDPFCGLADAALLTTHLPDLDIDDGIEPTTATLIGRGVIVAFRPVTPVVASV